MTLPFLLLFSTMTKEKIRVVLIDWFKGNSHANWTTMFKSSELLLKIITWYSKEKYYSNSGSCVTIQRGESGSFSDSHLHMYIGAELHYHRSAIDLCDQYLRARAAANVGDRCGIIWDLQIITKSCIHFQNALGYWKTVHAQLGSTCCLWFINVFAD